jgi:hypothetical protein
MTYDVASCKQGPQLQMGGKGIDQHLYHHSFDYWRMSKNVESGKRPPDPYLPGRVGLSAWGTALLRDM